MILKFQNTGLIKSGTALGGIKEPTPPGPVLPPFTIRVKFSQGYTPTMGDTQTLVDAEENIWDITKNSTDWIGLFIRNYDEDSELLEVLAANTTGVTNMSYMFYECTKLTTVSLFDTSSVTSMEGMFEECRSLTTAPLFNTSNVTSMYYMFTRCSSLTVVPLFNTSNVTTMSFAFYNCRNVHSGALALYQQASSQTRVPTHGSTFHNCGIDTTTGAAELAQIPLDWIYEPYED